MSKSVWKGSTLLSPVPPALIVCGNNASPNVFTVAWTGIINSQPPKTYISVRPERYSHGLIEKTGEFTVNLPTRKLVHAVDFCGVRSGRDMNKFEKCALTPVPASRVGAPILEEAPISLECRVFERVHYGTHDMFLADIVAVDADDFYIDKDGKLDLSKAGLIAYAHGEYYVLGERIGKFGYSVRRRKNARK